MVETNSAMAAVRHSLYTPELNLLAETTLTTGTPTIAHEYVWFAGQPVAQIDVAADTVVYTFTDHLGTPVLQTDAAANVVWRVEYEPYGKVHSYRAGATRHQPLRVPGQEYDAFAAERAYNIFRWYRFPIGRYTQGDPIELQGGLNLFQYSRSNPVRYIDPLGLWCGSGWNDPIVPDKLRSLFGTIGLADACRNHDHCYSMCNADKAACDWALYTDISKECAKVSKVIYAQCKMMAAIYHTAVATLGGEPFKQRKQHVTIVLDRNRHPHPPPKAPYRPPSLNCATINGKMVCAGPGI